MSGTFQITAGPHRSAFEVPPRRLERSFSLPNLDKRIPYIPDKAPQIDPNRITRPSSRWSFISYLSTVLSAVANHFREEIVNHSDGARYTLPEVQRLYNQNRN